MEFIQRGDISAFDELYHRYSQRLLLYFFRELGCDEQKAQDFLQDAFLKILEKPGLFDPERKFSTWIFTVAYNMCKNEYRRLQAREIVENDVDIDDISQRCGSEDHPSEQNVDRKMFEKALLAELEKFKSRLFYTTQKLAAKLKAFNPYKTEVSTDEKIK